MELLRKQPPNRRVLLATLPCVAGGIYFFGWRSLAVVLLACLVGFLCEWLFCRRRSEPVSEAVFVSAVLFSLIIPPNIGWHVVIVGMVVAIIFAKEVFGGFGRNIFNPAMAGRCFVYVCFASAMTGNWAPNALELPDAKWYGALDRWTTIEADRGDVYAVSSATSFGKFKTKSIAASEDSDISATSELKPPKISKLWWGDLSGAMGVTSSMLILIGGLYLFITATANRRVVLSVVISGAIAGQLYNMLGVTHALDAIRTMLSGGFFLGAFFMATDPISGPKTNGGRIVFGIIVGVGAITIKVFSVFNGGFMFALLMGNMFAPSIDVLFRTLEQNKKAKLAAAAEKGGQS